MFYIQQVHLFVANTHNVFFNCRSILWGPAAVEHHKTRKSLGASLWKQASSDDLLALLNSDRMLQTIAHFPQQRRIIPQVGILMHVYFPKLFYKK